MNKGKIDLGTVAIQHCENCHQPRLFNAWMLYSYHRAVLVFFFEIEQQEYVFICQVCQQSHSVETYKVGPLSWELPKHFPIPWFQRLDGWESILAVTLLLTILVVAILR